VFVIDASGTITWTWITSREKPQPDYDLVVEEARKAAGS
jgi:peroxiredoxin